jgi:hypothetical protein
VTTTLAVVLYRYSELRREYGVASLLVKTKISRALKVTTDNHLIYPQIIPTHSCQSQGVLRLFFNRLLHSEINVFTGLCES